MKWNSLQTPCLALLLNSGTGHQIQISGLDLKENEASFSRYSTNMRHTRSFINIGFVLRSEVDIKTRLYLQSLDLFLQCHSTIRNQRAQILNGVPNPYAAIQTPLPTSDMPGLTIAYDEAAQARPTEKISFRRR